MSALATNGHVLDKSKTNPLEFSSGFVLDFSKTCPLVASQTRICPYLACFRHVLDKSARWSLGNNVAMAFTIFMIKVTETQQLQNNDFTFSH